MSKLNPEDLTVTSFETAGAVVNMEKPPVCPETVSRCMGDCSDSAYCSDLEPAEPFTTACY